jgi:hypothetical protein
MSPRALAATLPTVTKPVLAKHGRAYASLIGEWTNIVGPALAGSSLPEKLAAPAGGAAGGVLTVRVAGAAATEFQHLAPQIIDRINTYLGFAAVVRLKLIQAPLPGPRRRPAPRPLTPSAEARKAVAAAAESVADPVLHDALVRFGETIAAGSVADPVAAAKPATRPREAKRD